MNLEERKKTMVLHTNFVCELKIRIEKKMNLLVLGMKPPVIIREGSQLEND